MRVAIIDYDSGNLHSAEKAVALVGRDRGAEVAVTSDPAAVARADRIVLPGDGAFPACRAAFDAVPGMLEALTEAVMGRGVPFLGICVGMQLLFTNSEEAPGVSGLNLIPGTVKKFQPAPDLKVPQMGWNALERRGQSPILHGLGPDAYAYFVHSYYVPLDTAVEHGAVTNYGVPFWSAISRGNLHAAQFHPEKSGAVRLALLSNFRREVAGGGSL